MQIDCPKCNGEKTAPRRHEKTQREMGSWRCADCNYVWTPTSPKPVGVDLRDRITVLQLQQSSLESRLYATQIPQEMIRHAQKLEQQASELLQKAQRIRDSLKHDLERQDELKHQFYEVGLEILACEYFIRAGVVATKEMLKTLVLTFTKRK